MIWVFDFISSFIATVGFAIFFNIQKKVLVWVGLVGTVGWMLSVSLIEKNTGAAWSYMIAAMAVAFLAEFFAIETKNPSTIFSIPGIYPLVPGYGLYKTMYYFTNNEMELGLETMVQTIAKAGAIAVGLLIIASMSNIRKKIIERKKDKKSIKIVDEDCTEGLDENIDYSMYE